MTGWLGIGSHIGVQRVRAAFAPVSNRPTLWLTPTLGRVE